MTINKNIIFATASVAVLLVGFAFFANTASAQTSCGSCGGDTGGGFEGNGGGYSQGGYYSQVSYSVPASCDSFTGSPTSLPYGGGNVTLEWETTNATSVSINNGVGTVSADGSTSVNVTQTTTFRLTAQGAGAGGNDSCNVTITVEPQTAAATCDSFTANPTSLPYGGGNVTLTWNTTNADSVSINNGVGTVSDDGSTSVNVANTITYTLTAVGANGNDTCNATITVAGQSTDPSITIIKRDAADKDDNQTVAKGGTATFEIVVTNNGNEDLKEVVVTDPLEPNCNKTIGNLAIGQSNTYTCTSTNVQNDFTNVANVTGKSVVDNQVVNDSDPTNVDVTTVNDTLRCDSFTASDYNVRKGARVTLTWNTTGATSVSISPDLGAVAVDGSADVTVDSDTTYTLTLSDGNDSKTCKVSIETESSGGGGSPSPKCELEISDKKVKAGEKITLTWDTSNATEITITDNHGNEIFTTDDYKSSDKKKYFDGEIDVIVYKDTKFTLLAERGSKERKCNVEVEVGDGGITVIEKREQPLVAGIALTQVPYTGFEAGPMLTFLFYGILALWALFVAYILVVKKGSVLGFSLSTNNGAEMQAQEDFAKKVQMLAAKHSHQNWG